MHNPPLLYVLLAGIGLVTGGLAGLTGASGMSVLISGLLLAGFEIREVIGLTFVVTLANALAAIGAYWRNGHVDGRATAMIALPAAMTVYAGHNFAGLVAPELLTGLMVCCLLAIGVKFAFYSGEQEPETAPERTPPTRAGLLLLLPIGCLMGLIMGMMGGGGAVFISIGLILLLRFPTKAAIGTSVAIMGLAAIPGVAAHWSDGSIRFSDAAVILLASTPTAVLASRYANRVSGQLIRRTLGIYLVTISLFLLGRLVT